MLMKSLRPISVLAHHAVRQPRLIPARASPIIPAAIPTQTTAPVPQRRPFLQNALNADQNLTASRVLRFPSAVIYDIISDVGSYSQFLPYCQSSKVTKTSQPASDGKRYPEEATLVIGFNDTLREAFTSRIYCVPGRIVEATSGEAETALSGDDIRHHNPRPELQSDASRVDTIMRKLTTRWTLRPYHYKPPPAAAVHVDSTHKNHEETSGVPAQQWTEVHLTVNFQFRNPMYSVITSAAAPKVAEKMITAFEDRVRAVMQGPAAVSGQSARTPVNDGSLRDIGAKETIGG